MWVAGMEWTICAAVELVAQTDGLMALMIEALVQAL